ncbi:MAG TPA: hypothetical protein VNH11_05135 [Pirellulales bacterium]|nr:hypothetical protein [Pirellulales bacterium]
MLAALALGCSLGWLGQWYQAAITPRQPHGKVVWVDERNQAAYVRFEDPRFLKSVKTVAIYDSGEKITRFANFKATARVNQFLGPNVVEIHFSHGSDQVARMRYVTNPIVEGDTVYSPDIEARP